MRKESKLVGDYKEANLTGLPNSIFRENKKCFIRNVFNKLKNFDKNSLLIMEGGKVIPRFDTDTGIYYFYQDPNFYYLTGINEPNFFLVVDFISEEITVFMTMPDEKTKIYQRVPSLQEIRDTYNVNCESYDVMFNFIATRQPNKIFRLKGTNSDSNLPILTALFNPPENLSYLSDLIDDNPLIYEMLADSRIRKNELEIDVIKYLSEVNSDAHNQTIKKIKPDLIERQVENFFLSYFRTNYYAREYPYKCVIASGINSATIHYNKNDNVLLKTGDLIIMDVAMKIGGYCSDVTSTVPISGKFSDKQKGIYNLVLKANRTIIQNAKVGLSWKTMHLLAEKVILEGLVELKILNSGFDISEMLNNRVAYYFMPHGLGHSLGLDNHDVGGYLSFTPQRSSEKGLSSLRLGRYLEEGMLVTVEPGIYFIQFLLESAFSDEKLKKYFNIDFIKSDYYNFGGVRIEDNCLVTKEGIINLNSNIARTVTEIEDLMK